MVEYLLWYIAKKLIIMNQKANKVTKKVPSGKNKTTKSTKCQRCGKPGGTSGMHSCPYAEDILDDFSECCNCCLDCARECAMDI